MNIDGHVEDPGRRDGSCRNLDRLDPEGFSSEDPLKGSKLLVDDGVVVVRVGILATGPAAVA